MTPTEDNSIHQILLQQTIPASKTSTISLHLPNYTANMPGWQMYAKMLVGCVPSPSLSTPFHLPPASSMSCTCKSPIRWLILLENAASLFTDPYRLLLLPTGSLFLAPIHPLTSQHGNSAYSSPTSESNNSHSGGVLCIGGPALVYYVTPTGT